MKIYPQLTSDAEFQSLGDLGYTGNINDRQYGFLSDRGLLGALSDMLYAWRTDPAKGYSANNLTPNLMVDFTNSFFVSDATVTTFADSITHARAGNATMVDSDGVLKWAPHNLLTYSEDFSNAAWAKGNLSVSANATAAPDGTTTADKVTDDATSGIHRVWQTIPLVPTGATHIFSVWAKADDLSFCQVLLTNSANVENYASIVVNLSAGAITQTDTGANVTIVASNVTAASNGWYRILLEASTTGTFFNFIGVCPVPEASGNTLGSTGFVTYSGVGTGFFVWGAHIYRSDLGGMVNNPDRGDSYVPTTSAAVYLPRRGHHVWNGSAWVDEGILHESEARTNLITYSNDFTDASWGKTNTTVVANAVVSPDGNTNASKITQTSGGDWRIIHNLSASVAPHTGSIWLKTVSGSGNIGIRIFDNTVGFTDVLCAVTEVWTRFSVTDVDGGAAANFYVDSRVAGSDLTEVYVYGAQLEAGSTPSSYIPTAGSTATRAAETLTIPAANLPWPSPVVIGEELVTNGTFDADSDWTKGTGWTISGGTANKSAGTGDAITQANISMVEGALYAVSYTVNGSTTGVCGAILTADTQVTGSLVGGNGDRVEYLRGTTGVDGYGVTANATFDGSIDNISVREIDPLAVSIAMEGRMTYADENSSSQAIYAHWYADANNYIRLALNTNVGGGGLFVRQKDGGVEDTVLSPDTYSPGVNVPFSIASRHGSTFVNGATDGTALTADTTPTALPDLSATDLNLGYDYMGTIKTFRVWDKDIGDTGIAGAST